MSLLNRITQNAAGPRIEKMKGEPYGSTKSLHPTGDYGRRWNEENRAAKMARCRALIAGGKSQDDAAKEVFGFDKWVRGLLEVNGGAL
jgi:hypothetical protein